VPPSKSWISSHLTEGEKRGNPQHNKSPTRVTFPAYPTLRKTGGAPEEKLKTSTAGAQGIKTLTKNNSRCINLNAE
jgi:hypothetical protein